MTRPHQVAVDLGPDLHCKLEDAAKGLGLTKSDFIRACVQHGMECVDCNAISKYFSNMGENSSKDQKGLNKFKKSTYGNAMFGITDDDWKVINLFRDVYHVPPKAKLGWAAISKVLKARRKEGFTQDELLDMVKKSPTHDMIASQLQRGGKPTLSGLLSEKMVGHLLTLTWNSPKEFGDMTKTQLENYKADMMMKHIGRISDHKRDVFYHKIEDLSSKDDVDDLVREFTQ